MKPIKFSEFYFLIAAVFFTVTLSAKDTVVSIGYFKPIFGHIHMNPSEHSQSLSTVACGHPIKVLKHKKDLEGFRYVQVGPYKGYIHKKLISSNNVSCVQETHPKFFDLLHLSLSDMYFWGKLQDQAIEGKSKVQ